MNLLQGIDNQYPTFVTLNPVTPPRKDLTFDVTELKHPKFTQGSIAAQKGIQSIQGQQHMWFCGAYQRYGFLEDGVVSALNVLKHLGLPQFGNKVMNSHIDLIKTRVMHARTGMGANKFVYQVPMVSLCPFGV